MSSLPMRNFVAVSFFLSCSAAFGQVQRLGAHPDSQVFQSVRRAIQEGELKVDVFEFRPTPRFVELSKKLGEFLKDYPNIAKQPRNGRRLPYDARMGISRQEYEEYLNFENRLNLKKKLTTTIDITKVSHERFRFDGRSLLPDLAIEIDFAKDSVRTPFGVVRGGDEKHSPKTAALANWDYWSWKSTISNVDNTPTTINFSIGRLRSTGRFALYYQVRQPLKPNRVEYTLQFDDPSRQSGVDNALPSFEDMQQESTRQNVKIEVPGKGVDGSLSYLSEKLDQCMKTTGTRFRSLSAKRDHIEGEFGPVRDFDAFCDCAGKLNFVKSVERDAKRRWVLINVDWEIVATQLPERTDGFGRGFDGGFPMDDLTDEFADPLADVAAETMPAEDSPEYYEVLVAKLKSGDIRAEREAAEALLKKSPKDLPNKAIHKSIAKAFLGLAKSPIPPTQELGIQGIVRFAGKQSVKPLAQMLKASMLRANPLIYDSLAKFPCEESAKAVASRLGNTFDTSLPIWTLIKMKEFAEPVAIEALHTNSPLRAAGAAQVLEYVGTSKCRSILRKAQAAGDPGVSRAARDALFAIQKRMEKNGD